MPDVTRVSIFDVDRTITRQPTYSAFLLFAARRKGRWRLALVPLVIGGMIGYKLGLVSRKGLKSFMQACLLARRVPKAELMPIIDSFIAQLMEDGVYPEAKALISREAKEGRRVMLATASHHFYIDSLARALGVADVIATGSVWRGDVLTATIAGENCYGQAKRDMVAAFFAAEGLTREACHVRVYSDDISDVPLFDWADEAVAVNPSRALLGHAQAAGWQVLDWR